MSTAPCAPPERLPVSGEEEVSRKPFDSRLFLRLLEQARPYWNVIAVSTTCLLLNAVLQAGIPLLSKIAVDRYLAPAGHSTLPWLEDLLPKAAMEGLLAVTLIYLSVLVASLLLEFGQQLLMQWTGQRVMFDLRRRIYSHLQRLDISYFDRHPAGRIVTRVTTDVDALNELFASGLVALMGDSLVLLFILITMFGLSPSLTFILMGVLPLVFAVTVVFRRTVQGANRRIRIALARINAYLQEHVNGITVLQLFNRERKACEDFDRINRYHVLAYVDAIKAYGWFYPAIEFLSMVGLGAMLAYGGWRVRNDGLTLGVLVAFFQYGIRIFRPIQDLSEKYNILQSALAASERIFELLDEPVKVTRPASAKPVPAGALPVEFENVWFAYKDEEWVIKDLTLRIEPGEVVAVVGHTGAGKTTLASLLLRFYDIQKGAIRLGGIDIREFDPLDLRRQFGVVLQDPHLFTGTIGDNIRLGSEEITDERIELASAQVNLVGFIDKLEKRYQHEVRERGAGLSTGHKQLIGFARALARNPRYLILDEATSSVDTETEIKVREALERMVEGRTSIIIAHRLSTIQRADRIIVMHKGRLRETGTHQELLAARGLYWKLYQLQYKDQEAVS
ncbi:MAG: ABC transporter ATP-binding protein [Bryobacteraceae bacterium]|nr:ABC transporter ATP-binding protein [Bryobacteraceae bacterium]